MVVRSVLTPDTCSAKEVGSHEYRACADGRSTAAEQAATMVYPPSSKVHWVMLNYIAITD